MSEHDKFTIIWLGLLEKLTILVECVTFGQRVYLAGTIDQLKAKQWT